jgi:hypothetical protein
MTSSDLNKWLTLGANLGVFLGLILVAYEINQSGAQLDLASSADGADNFTQAMETLAQDEGLSKLIFRAERSFEELDEFEKWRVSKYLDGFMVMSQQDYLVFSEINDKTSLGFEMDWRENMALPVYRDYWDRRQARFSAGFRDFINDIIAELDSR